jgi:hypothetical protein
MPKSVSSGAGATGSRARSTFAGFTSRCSTPRPWACASASSNPDTTRRTVSQGHAPTWAWSVPCAAHSEASHGAPAASPALAATSDGTTPMSSRRATFG